MKKSLLALLMPLVAALAVTLWAVGTVARSIDDNTITQQIVVGDPTVADGITFCNKSNFGGYLHWETTVQLSEGKPHWDTVFTYTADREYEMEPYEPLGVSMWVDPTSEIDTELPKEMHEGYSRLMYELYMETGEGETGSRTAKLRDVYEYYPVCMQIDFAESWFYSNEYLYMNANSEDNAYVTDWLRVDSFFKEYFRIPVITDEEYGMTVDKHGNGFGASFGLTDSAVDADQYHMNTYGCAADHGGWFVFNTHTTKGNVVDTSLIPHGYGIYYLPVADRDVHAAPSVGILVEEMRCIYPMDPNVLVRSLHLSDDGSKLVVSYLTDDGSLWADVVSAADGTRLQTIGLYVPAEERDWVEVVQAEDCILYMVGAEQLVLLAEGTDGYEVKVNVPIDLPEDFFINAYTGEILWDGQRLVAVGRHRDYNRLSGMTVLVYTAEGLQYAGLYSDSTRAYNLSEYGRYTVQHDNTYPQIVSVQ